MKKLLAVLITFVMCLGMASTAFSAEFKFTDVKEGDWFYKDVKSAVEQGLINGKSETSYAPGDNLTYAEAIKLAACMHQLYLDGAVTISGGNPWYQPYVEYCIENEIIDKEYNYGDKATRAGYMGIFAKALPEEALKEINNVPDNSIPDVPSSRNYAPGVYKLYRAGILTGVDAEHNCNPLANITRGEVAAILARMMNEDKRVAIVDMAEEEKEPEEKETEEVKEPEEKETEEVKEPEEKETEEEEETVSSGGAKNKFEQGEDIEYKKEDFTMTIEDTFVVTGRGIVISGRVEDGILEVGDTIYINDADGIFVAETKVKEIEMFRKSLADCQKGDNAGLNIDLDVDTYRSKIVAGMVASATKGKVVGPLAIAEQPETEITGTAKSISRFSVVAEGGTAPYTYQWKMKTIKTGQRSLYLNIRDIDGTISGATKADLSIVFSEVGTYALKCTITDANGDTVTTKEIIVNCETVSTGGRTSIPTGKNEYIEE